MARAKLLAILIALVSASAAHGSLLFEPYGGYSVGTLSQKYSDTYTATPALAGTTDSASLNGLGYGGRVGFLLHHFVVVAGEYQAIDAKEKRDSTTVQTDWKSRTLFATIGFQSPGGLRLLGSFGFDAKADESTSPNVTHYKGTAAKLLLGWHLPTTMAINLEYTIYRYTDTKVNDVSGKLSDSFSKFDTSSAMATISFPFELFGGGGGGRGGSRSSSR